jgi:ABC-2 type transport system permease protein
LIVPDAAHSVPLLLPQVAQRGAAQGNGPRPRGPFGVVGIVFWGVAFGLLYRVLRYFAGVEEIGALLAGKLLGLLLLSFAAILLLSNIIAALSSFFLARDLDLLVSSPTDWLSLYGSRLFETALHSSWMVVLLAVPMLAAYGSPSMVALVRRMAVAGSPFLIIPAALGSDHPRAGERSFRPPDATSCR